MQSIKLLFKLYIVFFKVGLFTVGGGYAMLPILDEELVRQSKLSTKEQVLEAYSLSQTLPGVIGANAAALMGYRIKGVWGALFCTLGVITPSIGIIIGVAMLFKHIEHLKWVENAFKGIRVAVLALLLESFVKLFKVAVFDKKTFAIASLSFVLVLLSWLNPILLIIAGAILGSFIYRERVGQ